MRVEIKEVYRCDHCNKLYQIKSACISHEKACKKNPKNHRACHNCHILRKVEASVFNDDMWAHEEERRVDLLYCNILNSHIHPPNVEHKGNAFDTGDIPNIPMPKECEHETQNHAKVRESFKL